MFHTVPADILPILIPVIAVQLILMITAVIHVLKHPHYRMGNKVIWILVVLLIQIVGPVVYFAVGRGEEE